MSDQSIETFNAQSLKSWNEWKKICSINACAENFRKIMASEVVNAFRKKFIYLGIPFDEITEIISEKNTSKEDSTDSPKNAQPIQSSNNSNSEKNFSTHGQNTQYDFWSHEFDCGLLEGKSSQCDSLGNPISKMKRYKNKIWEDIERSSDPPLKIIRGNLLGKHGVINDIAERFLQNNYQQIWQENGKDSGTKNSLLSLNSPVDNNQENYRERGDLCEEIPQESISESDQNDLTAWIKNRFSTTHAAILLAYLSKVSMDNSCLNNFIGLKKTRCSEILKKEISEILKSDPEKLVFNLLKYRDCAQCIKKLLKNQLRAEKNSESFLYMIEQAENNLN